MLIRSLLLLLGLAVTAALPALQPVTFRQPDKTEVTLGADVRRVYVTADRAGDKLMASTMEGHSQAVLDAQQAVVIADISGAPFFVKRIIRSSLRDREYTTWMDLDGVIQPQIPHQQDTVTVIDLERGAVAAVRHVDTVEALRAELGITAAP